jgi:ribosomal protein S18 acetylase RimI-like enzyme
MAKGKILLAEQLAEASIGPILGCIYTEQRGQRGYLGMLAIDPAHQRKGIGQVLLRAAEALLRHQGCLAVDIFVLSLRPELPAIYRRFGYVETGVEPFHPSRALKPGVECHSIVLSKQL